MPKILVVDDDNISTSLLSSLLIEQAYEVTSAGSGAEAIALGIESSPHLLISDWRLGGGVSGNGVAEELQRRDPGMKVIFITGMDIQVIEKCMTNINVAAVVPKPYDFDQVVGLIKEILPPS